MRNVGRTSRRWLWVGACIAALTVASCADDAAESAPDCPIDRDDARWEDIEVTCDGLDNDCDGQTDVLLPVAANRCEASPAGVCHFGFASCTGTKKACVAPFATPEAHDGLDNDCDGLIDDVMAGVDVEVRLRLMVPPSVWAGSPEVVRAARLALEQQGVPYDADAEAADWDAGFANLDSYSVVVFPGYVSGTLTSDQTGLLRKWVARGGVLVMFRVLKATGEDYVFELAGIQSEKRRTDIERVHFDASPVAYWLDSPQERNVRFNEAGSDNPLHLYLPASDPSVAVVAYGETAGGAAGAVAVRRALGHGAVYTFGFDLLGFHPQLCYVNCFDPGRDIFGLLMLGALREATKGHYAVEHTVPGPEPGVFIATHDVDAPDAFWDGEWGRPGALRMAEMERELEVAASYFITSDYVTNYWRPALVRELCARGNCPDGGHSVQHLDWSKLPMGDCNVTRASYDPAKPTLCGEVVVNHHELITAALPRTLPWSAWRTPYLKINPLQFELLAAAHVQYDTSMGMGDVRTNMPFLGSEFAYHQHDVFRGQPIYEFPVTLEDGIGWFEGDVEKRVELSAKTWPRFRSHWIDALVRNAGNRAWTVLLVHPSFGVGAGIGPENVAVKIAATRFAIETAQELGLHIARVSELGPFWRGRDAARLLARYIEGQGYVGKVYTGGTAAPDYTLEFGDRIASFECKEAGPVRISGRHVTFELPLLPHRIYHFRATVH